jgi:hypothetical protein
VVLGWLTASRWTTFAGASPRLSKTPRARTAFDGQLPGFLSLVFLGAGIRVMEWLWKPPGVTVHIEYGNRSWSGIMQWNGETPSIEKVVEVLSRHVGEDLRGLGNLELD